MTDAAHQILPGTADGPVLALTEGLSFWGGVNPATARIIDAHHPQHGADIAGTILLMSTTRGSCSGSGVVLDLALTGKAPSALIFSEAEDVATLGALIAANPDSPLADVVASGAWLNAHAATSASGVQDSGPGHPIVALDLARAIPAAIGDLLS